jgi:hypothetical protein
VQPNVDLPGARSAVEDSSGPHFEPFTRAFGRPLTVSELGQLAFAEDLNSPMDGVRIVVRNADLKAADLRALFARSAPDSPLRAWAVLGVAYGSELGAEDLEWLEALATASGSPGPVQLAAIHAVRAASGFDALDSAEAMHRVASSLLNRATEETVWWTDPGLCAALRLGIRPLDRLTATTSVAQLERLAWADSTPDELSEVFFDTLARAGGADGARSVLSAVMRGNVAAAAGLRAVRSESAEQELLTLIEVASTGGDTTLASAALTGLIASGSEATLDTLDSLLEPSEPFAAADLERRRQIALDGLARLSEPRSRGLFRRIQHHFEPLKDDPQFARSMQAANEATMMKEWLKPPADAQAAICHDLRRALDVLPRDSLHYSEAMYDLARVARRLESR